MVSKIVIGRPPQSCVGTRSSGAPPARSQSDAPRPATHEAISHLCQKRGTSDATTNATISAVATAGLQRSVAG